jgi:death-on-curing family protein
VAIKLAPEFIEHIHDVLVGAFLPFDEKVSPAEYRSRDRIESSVSRPFQTVFGEEAYPAIHQKAAALFHSLVCNHCFINGNKRTAVIGLDLFLLVNGYLLAMSSEEVYEVAKATATANQQGLNAEDVVSDLAKKIDSSSVSVELFKDPGMKARLGDAYENVAIHVERIASFAIRAMEVSRRK